MFSSFETKKANPARDRQALLARLAGQYKSQFSVHLAGLSNQLFDEIDDKRY